MDQSKRIWQNKRQHKVSGISDESSSDLILFFVNKQNSTALEVRLSSYDASETFVWHPENLGINPGFGASCHGQAIYPVGPLTKLSTSICFSFGINMRLAKSTTSKPYWQYFCITALDFSEQTVTKHSQSHWFCILFLLPKRIFLKVKGLSLIESHCCYCCWATFLPGLYFFVISTTVIMQITHSAGLLIDSTDNHTRFKCKLSLHGGYSNIIWCA